MDKILTKFTTLSSIPDVVFVTTEEFNAIFNFCSNVFELWLSCDGNGLVQARIEKIILPVEYADFADVFSPTLVRKLSPHALYDHAIEIGNS